VRPICWGEGYAAARMCAECGDSMTADEKHEPYAVDAPAMRWTAADTPSRNDHSSRGSPPLVRLDSVLAIRSCRAVWRRGSCWERRMALSTYLIIFIFLGRYFIAGLMAGTLKG
jgi:hypothetical protein